jgi:hypothetical protein
MECHDLISPKLNTICCTRIGASSRRLSASPEARRHWGFVYPPLRRAVHANLVQSIPAGSPVQNRGRKFDRGNAPLRIDAARALILNADRGRSRP